MRRWSIHMWPEGRRFAVALTFDVDAEEVWLADDPANRGHPVVLSQGAYGPAVGVPRILELLEGHGVRATFFVPGRVAETHPEVVETLVSGGHELACHGYTHRQPAGLEPQDEELELRRGREALDRFGVPLIGYRAPGWDLSPRTLGLLPALGFTYSSNLMDAVHPYRHRDVDVIELPVHWVLDDAPHVWFDAASWSKTIRTAAEVRALWEEEVLGIRALGGLAVVTMHPQLIGRPGRLAMLDGFLGWVRGLGDAWLATCSQLAEEVRRTDDARE